MMRQYELVERVKSYDPGADEEALNRAYVFSMKAHGNQQRASGDSYFSHFIDLATLASKIGRDPSERPARPQTGPDFDDEDDDDY